MTCTFSKCGPKQTKRQLQAVARSLGIVFPDEYRDFLLKQNGGVPKPNKMSPVSGRVDSIEFFYSISARTSERDLAKTTQYYRDELELPLRYLPVALSETHDVLLLNVAGRSAGKVDWWTTVSEGFSTRRVSRYCQSLSALVELLEAKVTRSTDEDDFRELFLAINNGKKREVARLLKTLDLTALPSDQPHPVVQVVYAQNPGLLQLLLELGMSTRVKDPLGKSAMAIAKEKLKYAKFADATYGTREAAKELKQMEEIVALLTPRDGNGRRT